MVSIQRRRGSPAWFWPVREIVDNRGNRIKAVDMSAEPFRTRVSIFPQRSSKAELAGQQQINIIRVNIDPHVERAMITLWGRCYIPHLGTFWDIAGPPAWHQGTRGTRHWSLDLRERPDEGTGDGRWLTDGPQQGTPGTPPGG